MPAVSLENYSIKLYAIYHPTFPLSSYISLRLGTLLLGVRYFGSRTELAPFPNPASYAVKHER